MATARLSDNEPDWIGFFMNCNERTQEVINNGPMLVKDFGHISKGEKMRGLVTTASFGKMRGSDIIVPNGRKIIYFDPDMAYNLEEDAPENIKEKHSDEEVKKYIRSLK